MLTGNQAAELGLVTPIEVSQIQPASIDVRLDRHFVWFPGSGMTVDPAVAGPDSSFDTVSDGHCLHIQPGEFLLAATYETVQIPSTIVATFEGRSSWGRIGLGTHVTAGFIDPGFEGQITLELHNVSQNVIKLWPGMKIGQICFMWMDRAPELLYGQSGNSYQGQRGPTPYRVSKTFTKGLPDGA